MEQREIQLISNRESEVLFSEKMYKAFYPKNTAGYFKSPMPYMNKIQQGQMMALVAKSFTPGFFNVLNDEPIRWYRSKDNVYFEEIGTGYLKEGYYPTAQHLTMAIINVIFEINRSLRQPYPQSAIPLLYLNADGHVVHKSPIYTSPDGNNYNMYVHVSRPIAILLGCAVTGSCVAQNNQRLLHFEFPLLTNLEKPSMKPPYKYLHLKTNLCTQPLMSFRFDDLTYGITEYVDPTFVYIDRDFKHDDPIIFYFVDENGSRVGKEGQSAFVVKFAEQHNVKPEKRGWTTPKFLSAE